MLAYGQFVEYIRASISRFSVAWLNDFQSAALPIRLHSFLLDQERENEQGSSPAHRSARTTTHWECHLGTGS